MPPCTACARAIPAAASNSTEASSVRPSSARRETVRLYRLASHAAAQLGFPLAEASVGGGSDGNLTASLGIPTLDGLGAVGDHAHSPNEFVLARQMPRRAALLAHLIESLSTV